MTGRINWYVSPALAATLVSSSVICVPLSRVETVYVWPSMMSSPSAAQEGKVPLASVATPATMVSVPVL